MNLSTWIERWADFQPNKTALHFEGRDITYRALYERVLQFADILGNQLGVRPTDRVALLGYNSADVVALVFACARLGAIFVPLNWRLVTAEILVILKDALRRGYHSLKLETGAMPEFAAGRTLYERHGFVRCGPFGSYSDDPNSVFMTKALAGS
jgi:acyl-CoA synthetase (AMP-forming)/AMP-acid ligase II